MLFDYLGTEEDLDRAGVRACHVCGSANTNIDENVFILRALGVDNNASAPSGPVQFCATLHCADCHTLRLIAIRPDDRPAPLEDSRPLGTTDPDE